VNEIKPPEQTNPDAESTIVKIPAPQKLTQEHENEPIVTQMNKHTCKSTTFRFQKVNNPGDSKWLEIQPFLALVVTKDDPLYNFV
jgi:hypothetical protein